MTKLKSNSGFGIIEILIAFGLVGILTAVMTTLFTNIQKQQRQAGVTTTLISMRETIVKMLSDGRAWENTISDPLNANAQCLLLRDGTCATSVPALPDPNPLTSAFFAGDPAFLPLPVLRDSGAIPGSIFINSTNPTAGFTNSGSPCNTFDIAAGNDNCPVRWEIVMQFTCPAASPCVDPAVRVIAYMFYRPSAASGLASTINENRFIIAMSRGSRGENKSEPFEFAHQGATQNTGGGACTPGAWSDVDLVSEVNDPADNAAPDGAGGVVVDPGTYTCSATTSCFTCGSLRMRLLNQTAGVELAVSPGKLSPEWSLTTDAVSNVTFIANGPTVLRLQHYCLTNPPAPVTYGGKGLVLAPYTTSPTKFSTLNCTRVF